MDIMDSGVIGGIVGGVASLIIGTIITKSSGKKSDNGELKFGLWIFVLGLACLSFVLFSLYFLLFGDLSTEDNTGVCAAVGLILGFGLGAIYSFGEGFKVRGNFNNESIEFHTPWTGSKSEKWSDLESVKFNSQANWYVLKFNSGVKIRLSALLSGHGLVLEHIKTLGIKV